VGRGQGRQSDARAGRGRPLAVERHILILVTLALVAFGLVMVYSATSGSATVRSADPGFFLKRQAGYALLGVLVMLVTMRVPVAAWRRLAPALVVGSLILLAAVLVVAPPVNGAKRWIGIGPAVFQPSEFAKLALAVWAAAYFARTRPPQTLRELARPVGLLVALFCGLVLLEPDLGTAIALLVMVVGMLVVAGTPARVVAAGSSLAVAVGVAAVWFEPYRRDRILAFLNPWDDAQGAGYQTVQAMLGLGSGGIFGRGLGNGVSKLLYLPEAHTDMIFAVIGEELGLVGAMALVAGFVAFAVTGFKIALGARDPFSKQLAAGITVLICGQAAINLAAVLGLAPLTGIPLPFVSYGGSSLVVGLACVGILLNIASGGKQQRARVPDRERGDVRPRRPVARDRRGAPATGRARDVRRVAGARGSSPRS
jgi:cell division protein FtsW